MAEWLRRLTRNQFPSGSVGSNPTNCVKDYFGCLWACSLCQQFLGPLLRSSSHQFLDSLVVRISACHVEGPGSIPGRGETFSFQRRVRFPSSTDITACDKFFRRHVGFTIRPNQPVLATPPEFDVDTVLASAVHILKLERYRED